MFYQIAPNCTIPFILLTAAGVQIMYMSKLLHRQMNSRHRNPPLSFSQHSRPHSRIHRGSRSPLTPPNPTDLHLFLTPFKTPLSAQLLNAAGRGFLDNGVLQIHFTAGHCERPHNRLLKETRGRRSKPSFVSRVRNPFQINTGNIADQKRLPSPKSRPLAY